ncbi:MAG TPA: hypothetical protein VJK53_05335 [Candidatus Paceibacterota bacterium]
MEKIRETVVIVGGYAFLAGVLVIGIVLAIGAAGEITSGGQSHLPDIVGTILGYAVLAWLPTIPLFIVAAVRDPAAPCHR